MKAICVDDEPLAVEYTVNQCAQLPQIEEATGFTNAGEALAYLRGKATKSPFSRIRREDRELFRERLRTLDMGLEDQMQQPVGQLSGGQRQALSLLMATIFPPELLLLDEHTAALDPAAADKVLTLTRKIVEEHKISCLMVTHNMAQALELGSRTLMMADGQIVLDLSGEKRRGMTVKDLVDAFHVQTRQQLYQDRILLS